MFDKGFLSATSISALSFFGPLFVAGMLHMEEAYCMLYMPVYLITIPSMYVLLVIYSFFNLWNVSWGTREVAQKKSQMELERERKEEEQRQADLKKKKKEGLLGTLMEQFNLGGDKGDTASVDFSIGNVLRCMCFSHEDPLEPKKQLVKIAATLDEVSKRLDKISPAGAAPGLLRRKSSYRGSIAQRKSLGSVPEQNVEQDEKTFDSVDLHEDVDDIDSSEDSAEETIYKEERDDEMNPFWIEDADLKNGHRDYLTLNEVKFWKDLIKKYLEPLQMTKKQKDDQANELKDYRDIIIFTFLMINILYIVGVTMLQVQANLSIPWLMFAWTDNVEVIFSKNIFRLSTNIFQGMNGRREDGIVYNLTYVKPASADLMPEVRIGRTTDKLDMLGLFFLITFSAITLAQMVGMIMHRWQTRE